MRYTSLTLLALGSSPLSSSTCWAQNLKGGDAIVDSTGTGASLLSSLVGNKKNTNKNHTVLSNNKNKNKKVAAALTNHESIESMIDADVGVLAATSTAATTAFQGEEARRRLDITIGSGSCSTGTNPCLNVGDPSSIGDRSCNGNFACNTAGPSFTVANDSCNSNFSCFNAGKNGIFIGGSSSCIGVSTCLGTGADGYAKIGDGSCLDLNYDPSDPGPADYSCKYAGKDGGNVIIGKGSCNGRSVCLYAGYDGGNVIIGNGSCTVSGSALSSACLSAGAYSGDVKIGDTSCIDEFACTKAGGVSVIGSGSCQGDSSCYQIEDSTVGDNSCTGDYSCYYIEDSTVGDYSCTCEYCCYKLPPGSLIGDRQCTSLEDGCSNYPVIINPLSTPLIKLGDYDATNELQSLGLNGTVLTISGGNQVDLAPLLPDEPQPQSLAINGTDLTISDGNTIDLSDAISSVLVDNDARNELQFLALNGTSLSISDGNQVDLASILVDNDARNELQFLALNGTSLSISDGNEVDLASILVDNDASNELQSLGIAGTDLTITDGDPVDISPLFQLGFTPGNTTLSIVGGNEVDLAPLLEAIEPQSLAINGTDLTISDGNTIDLSGAIATVLTYQAFVEGISKDSPSFFDLVYLQTTPIVINYGISGITGGWTLIEASRLVGMSITPNTVIEEGSVVVTVLITDPIDSLVDGDFGSLTINANDGISKAETFDNPMTIYAGSRVSIKVERIGEVRPYNNDAGVMLQFEQ